MKIVYGQANYSRKKEYRLITKIIKIKNSLLVRKEVENKEAINFLKKIENNRSKIEKNLTNAKVIKIININKNYLDFEYIDQPSFEFLIEKAIIDQNFSQVKFLTAEFFNFINNQKKIIYNFSLDNKFSSIFCQPINLKIKKNTALSIGLLDLNFDNLLFDQKTKKIYLIDWEWFFDFPLPLDFIIFRSILYLSFHLQPIIKTFCSEKFPCIEILKDFFVPQIIWEEHPFSLEEIKQYLIMENNLQNYVSDIPPKFNESIFLEKLNNKTNYEKPKEENKTHNQEIQKIQLSLIQEVKMLKDDLQKIQSSKVYKFWQTYCKIRDKILKILKN